MPGIANLTVDEFQERINRFAQRYVDDWNEWLNVELNTHAELFGKILRRWQACRPNRMRRTQAENLHEAPYLEDLINQAAQNILTLQNFDIRNSDAFLADNCCSLFQLWDIFQELPYAGHARNGLAGVAGISKAVLLLTNGQVGPVFNSEVRKHLELGNIANANEWINALRKVSQDIWKFEAKNKTTLRQATPRLHAHLQNGRIYDMALGPGDN